MYGDAYPQPLLIIVTIVGIVLALFRPRWAFLLMALGAASQNYYSSNKTRTSFFGPYYNLIDAWILIGLIALVIRLLVLKKPLIIPAPLGWIFAVWFMGSVVGISSNGTEYVIIREIRWALSFPIAFLLGANFVQSEEEAREFILILYFGVILASFQYLYHVASNILQFGISYDGLFSVHTSGFTASPSAAFLIALATGDILERENRWIRASRSFVIVLLALVIVLWLFRSLWIAIVATLFTLVFLFPELRNRVFRALRTGLMALIVLELIVGIVLPELNPLSIIDDRMGEMAGSRSYMARENAITAEFDAWMNGNMFIGNGFAFDKMLATEERENVAWGHLGYLSYLARLGVVGLFIYGIYLPLSGIQAGRRLFHHRQPSIRSLGLLGVCTFIVDAITFTMSGSYFPTVMIASGLFYGAVLSTSRHQTMYAPKRQPWTKELTRFSTEDG